MAPAVAPVPTRLGARPERLGPFRLLARIAEGRRSTVYAGDLGPATPLLAIRTVRPETDVAAFEARVRRHGLCLGAPSPTTVRVDGRPTYCDPLIVGENLATIFALTAPEPLPLAVAASIGLGIVEVLAQAALPHGDLIPRHVIVGFDGRVRLRDPAGHDAVDADAGRAPYRGPRASDGAPPRSNADLFSLGVMLFEVTTGVHPFAAAFDQQASARPARGVRLSPREIGGDTYPPELQFVLRRMLSSEPEGPFANAAGAHEALRRAARKTGRIGPSVVAHWLSVVARARHAQWQAALAAARPAPAAAEHDDETRRTALADVRPRPPTASKTAPGAPTTIAPVLAAESADSDTATSLDALEEVAFDPVPEISTLVPPPMAPARGHGPVEAPHPVAATQFDIVFPPLQRETVDPPDWGSPDMEAAFDEASWDSAPDLAPTGVDLPRLAATPPDPLSDTVDDSSSTDLLDRDDLVTVQQALEVFTADPESIADDTRPLRAAPLVVAEPPPLVPPAPSNQAEIATHVVRARISAHTPKITIDAPTPMNETREPSVVVPIADEPLPRRRPVLGLYVASAVALAAVIAAGFMVGRILLDSTVSLPAPVSSTPSQEQDDLRGAAAPEPPSRVRLEVLPAHATVTVDGREVENETYVVVERRPVTIEARAPGYAPQRRTLPPAHAERVVIRLRKRRPGRPPATTGGPGLPPDD